MQFGLAFGLRVQKGRALGRTQPLVAVAGVEIGAQGGQVQVNLAWCMRAVDQGRQAALARRVAHGRDGKDECRGRCDVAGKDHPRARRDGGHHPIDKRRSVKRQRDLDAPDHRAGTGADMLPGGVASAVLVVGGQHLVAGLQAQRLRHRVDARGGIGQEDQIGSLRTQAACQPLPRLGQQRRRASAEKGHRVALELELPMLVAGENVSRASAEAAVVQEDEPGLQKKLLAQGDWFFEPRRGAVGDHTQARRLQTSSDSALWLSV